MQYTKTYTKTSKACGYASYCVYMYRVGIAIK